jgi:hypothetical protein
MRYFCVICRTWSGTCRCASCGIWDEQFPANSAESDSNTAAVDPNSLLLSGDDIAFLVAVGVWECHFSGLVYEWHSERGEKSDVVDAQKFLPQEKTAFLRWLSTKRVRLWIDLKNGNRASWRAQ